MKLWRYGRAIERLGQRYRLEGVLGSGGMADVCLAWDERLKREVAIKVIKPNELDQRSLDRFLKEAAQIARWRHPNILRIYGDVKLELLDASHGSIVPYIVMEYAQGGDLHKRMTPGKPYPLGEMLSIFAQLCGAVAYAHNNNIIHRDLKPLNILFRVLPNNTEQAVLSDFGLAVDVEATHFTFAGAGTLPYMAPEQLRGHAQAASDIFALGVILFQLGTGHLPFQRELHDLHQPLAQPSAPNHLNPWLPIEFNDLILKALHKDPAQRYPDALALWEAIYNVIANDPHLDYLLADLGGQTSDMPPVPLTALTTPAPSLPPRSLLQPDNRNSPNGPDSPDTPNPNIPPASPPGPLTPQARQTGQITKAPPTKTNISRLGTAQLTTPPIVGIVPDYTIPRRYPSGTPTAPNTPARDIHETELVEDPDIHTGKDFNSAIHHQPTRRQSARAVITNIPDRQFATSHNYSDDNKDNDYPAYPDYPDYPDYPADNNYLDAPSAGTGQAGAIPARTYPDDPSHPGSNSRIIKRASAQNSNISHTSHTSRPITRSLREPAHQTIVLPETPHTMRTGQQSSRSQSRQRITPITPITPTTSANPTRPTGPGRRSAAQFPQPHRRTYMLIAIPTILLLLIAGILVFIHPFNINIGALSIVSRTSTNSVNTTNTTTVTGNYTITAATNPTDPANPIDPAHQQIPLHKLSSQVPPATQLVTGTGHNQTPATQATGTLTFSNGSVNPFTVTAGTNITSKNGVTITVTNTIVIPGANPPQLSTAPATATASQAGANGNIVALDINATCCAAGNFIFVRNLVAFTGGQDAQNYTFVKQSDIDQAVVGLEAQQKQQGQRAIEGQLAPTDLLVNNAQGIQCTPGVTPDQHIGDNGANVPTLTATVTTTCLASAYDDSALQRLVTANLAAQIQTNPQLKGSSQRGTVKITLVAAQVNADGTVTLQVRAVGAWGK